MPVTAPHQVPHLFEGLPLHAEFDCVALLELGFEGEASGEGIGGSFVGHCPQILHFVVGRQREVERNGEVFGDGLGEEERNVSDGFGVGDVDVEDVVSAVHASEQWLAGNQQRERQTHLLINPI